AFSGFSPPPHRGGRSLRQIYLCWFSPCLRVSVVGFGVLLQPPAFPQGLAFAFHLSVSCFPHSFPPFPLFLCVSKVLVYFLLVALPCCVSEVFAFLLRPPAFPQGLAFAFHPSVPCFLHSFPLFPLFFFFSSVLF